LTIRDIINLYKGSKFVNDLSNLLSKGEKEIVLKGVSGSLLSFIIVSLYLRLTNNIVFILEDNEKARYIYDDINNIIDGVINKKGNNVSDFVESIGEVSEIEVELCKTELNLRNSEVLFYPSINKKNIQNGERDNVAIMERMIVLEKILNKKNNIVITHSEALLDKIVSVNNLSESVFEINKGEIIDIDFLEEFLIEYNFQRVDFVVEPGDYAIRGGIVDVFSYSNDKPYRIEFMGNSVDSIRGFDIESQLSVSYYDKVDILPNPNQNIDKKKNWVTFLDYFDNNSLLFFESVDIVAEMIDKLSNKYKKTLGAETEGIDLNDSNIELVNKEEFEKKIRNFKIIQLSNTCNRLNNNIIEYDSIPQSSYNRQMDLFLEDLKINYNNGIINIFSSDNSKQIERIYSIIEGRGINVEDIGFTSIPISVSEGFVDRVMKIAIYTDHQLFHRYHKYKVGEKEFKRSSLTIKDIYKLNKGDYVVHIDHGVGIFDGLEQIEINGKKHEAVRLVYKDNDLLYVSIHSIHKISKYYGKDSSVPVIHKLGSSVWQNTKKRAKDKMKDIARDLINLYAERKVKKGYRYMKDTYLQSELESSFIYEDTRDQIKSVLDVKRDMESDYPMDRLICGDVGFGKTEVAIRAAFKAVVDSKQVAVVVPTTILALQHYRTFSERLKDFPCNIDYINRFRSSKEQNDILHRLSQGKIDIIIGTHRLLSKDVVFKDLGLLIIDEEQKFGVASKEKLRMLKVDVDTLTLTATPIPRTLQFSLMGVRDISIISTPPQNRYPIQTELSVFSETIIREAIMYEVSRGGQVFFIHNRIDNIEDMVRLIEKICPEVSVCMGHGRMEGKYIERIMVEFINGYYDVFVGTAILESGIDIPNVNTIIINNAHHFGLSDLHQLRGRVGRSNRKAFCYLLSPPLSLLSEDARKRLKAIEEYSDLGSGFNIAMKDLEIRGAGNILGVEQSGFISEIGFEMYHRILDEAIEELKTTEYKDLYEQSESKSDFILKDCQIETDVEAFIPSYYVESSSERLNIYTEINELDNEKEIENCKKGLIDRFGSLPKEVDDLFKIVKIRLYAKSMGIEKIIYKKYKVIFYFKGGDGSAYYESEQFGKVINYVQSNNRNCMLKQLHDKLTLTINGIKKLDDLVNLIRDIKEKF